MIVKVQLPLHTTEPEPLALVYNRERTLLVQVPVIGGLVDAMRGTDGRVRPKAFFEATVIHDSVNIEHEVEDPGW